MGNVLIDDEAEASEIKTRNQQLGVALDFYGVSLILLLVVNVFLALLSRKIVIVRLNELIGVMPLIAFCVSMHLISLAIPDKRSIRFARAVALISLLIKGNNAIIALFSNNKSIAVTGSVLSFVSVVILLLAELFFNHGICMKFKEKDAKLLHAYIICCIYEYVVIVLLIPCRIATEVIEKKTGQTPLMLDEILNVVVITLIISSIVWKMLVTQRGIKLFAERNAGAMFKKSAVLIVVGFLILTFFMHAHQFNLMHVYNKTYDIWASGYLGKDAYAGNVDISSFDVAMTQFKEGPCATVSTFGELQAEAQNDSDRFVMINVSKNNIRYIGKEAYYYGALSSEEQSVMREIERVSYKFPQKAVVQGTYILTLDDGYEFPIVISDKMIEACIDDGNSRVNIPCFELVKSDAITDFYVNSMGFHGERYSEAQIWGIGEIPGTGWLDVVYDYCLNDYSLIRCAIFLTLFGITLAFIVWYGLKDSVV